MRETIFKGATRPPMKWGVPLMALVLVLIPLFMLTLLGGAFVSAWCYVVFPPLGAGAFIWMRQVSARDDQRLAQWGKAMKLTLLNKNRALFMGLRSYSPYRSHGASNVWRR